MTDLEVKQALGTRSLSDLTVTFDREFKPEERGRPLHIDISVKGGATVRSDSLTGSTGSFQEVQIPIARSDRMGKLGEFTDIQLLTVITEAFGPKWNDMNMSLRLI